MTFHHSMPVIEPLWAIAVLVAPILLTALIALARWTAMEVDRRVQADAPSDVAGPELQ